MKEKSKKKEKKSTKKVLAIGSESGIYKVVCPYCNAYAVRGTIISINKESGEMDLESGWQCPKCGHLFKEVK